MNFAELIFVNLTIDLKFVFFMRLVVKRNILAVGIIERDEEKENIGGLYGLSDNIRTFIKRTTTVTSTPIEKATTKFSFLLDEREILPFLVKSLKIEKSSSAKRFNLHTATWKMLKSQRMKKGYRIYFVGRPFLTNSTEVNFACRPFLTNSTGQVQK